MMPKSERAQLAHFFLGLVGAGIFAVAPDDYLYGTEKDS